MNNYGSETSAPFISLTPSEDTKGQAVPGRMRNSFSGLNGDVNGIGGGSSGVMNVTTPLMTGQPTESLGLAGADSISISPSPTSNSMDVTGANGGKRLRSGSLFSTNSIWNDDSVGQPSSQRNSAILDTSSMHSFDTLNKNTGNAYNGGNYLSPLLTAQNNTVNNSVPMSNSGTHRNRSYTTTAAIPNMNMFSMESGAYNPMDNVNQSRLLSSPSVAPSSKGSDVGSMLDNIMTINNSNSNTNANNNGNPGAIPRFRSQTFSGSTPSILDSSIQSGILNQASFSQQGIQHPGFLTTNNIDGGQFGQHSQNFGGTQQEQPGSAVQPLLEDDFNYSKLMITTNFENPSLGPTNKILFDNLPQFINAIKLWSILNNSLGAQRSLGTIRTVKVSNSTSPKLAIVECSSIDIAMALKANFNHLELVPGVVIYAAFAKLTETQPQGSEVKPPKKAADSKPGPTDIYTIQNRLLATIHRLAQGNHIDFQKLLSLINTSLSYSNDKYQDNFGPLPDPIPLRQFDSMKLRELRNVLEKMENGNTTSNQSSKNNNSSEEDLVSMNQLELEETCISMLNELPELCYDYLGNTIVQKLFTFLESPFIKLMMVKEVSPYLTQLSIHKNGTWAVQKIMNSCRNDYQQMKIIGEGLKPYAPKLFNDQFGNYVLQCCTKFGSPFNDFIFEAIVDKFVEISSGRFGARCIRTILESASDGNHITKEQEMLVAGLIVEFSNELVLNNNGSLLITWFLDSFNSKSAATDERFRLLTEKFLPGLDHLCTHKLANLTILKILNNRVDPQSRQQILDSVFGRFDDSEFDEQKPPSQLLEYILAESNENTSGPLFVQKILSNPLLFGSGNTSSPSRSSRYQTFVVSQVKRTLLEKSLNNIQPYKKLMEEVGIPTSRLNRSSSVGRKIRRSTRHKVQVSQHQPQQLPPSSTGSYIPNMYLPQSQFSPNVNAQMMMQNQQHGSHLPQSQDQVLMQQLEQLSLSSAALGYNSNPGTPGESSQGKSFF